MRRLNLAKTTKNWVCNLVNISKTSICKSPARSNFVKPQTWTQHHRKSTNVCVGISCWNCEYAPGQQKQNHRLQNNQCYQIIKNHKYEPARPNTDLCFVSSTKTKTNVFVFPIVAQKTKNKNASGPNLSAHLGFPGLARKRLLPNLGFPGQSVKTKVDLATCKPTT